jgi:hypothetical protein
MRFTQADAPKIIQHGQRMLKLPNPVYLQRVPEPFEVETTEGVMSAHAGDFVAHDPISGHVWPVQASYVEQHYRPAPAKA